MCWFKCDTKERIKELEGELRALNMDLTLEKLSRDHEVKKLQALFDHFSLQYKYYRASEIPEHYTITKSKKSKK